MQTVVLSDELREGLVKNAPDCTVDLESLVSAAVQSYIRELQRAKIGRELDAYVAQHERLRQTHFGRWVAFHDGELVDCDDDQQALYKRIRSKFGRTAVLMTEVREKPIQEIHYNSRVRRDN